MKFRIILVSVCIISLFYIAGCSRPIATVNGKKIDRLTFDLHLREKIEAHKQKNISPDIKRLKEAVIQELIVEKLILEDAEKQGINVSEDELNRDVESLRKNLGNEAFNKELKDKGINLDIFRNRIREKMIMSRFIAGLIREDSLPENEIMAYYKNSQMPFIKPGRVFLKMIEVQSEIEAQRIAEEIRSRNGDFDAVAKRLSDEKKASVIGYGWLTPDLISQGLAQAIKNLRNGQMGGPYKGSKNYYLIKVKERETERIAGYEEVRNEIKTLLLEQKRQETLAHWIEQKRKSSRIDINKNYANKAS